MEDKKALLNRIMVCDFVITETNLFLDTHPTCERAKEHMKKYIDMRNEAKALYNQNYGPISVTDYDGGDWKWISSPWPWELSEV